MPGVNPSSTAARAAAVERRRGAYCAGRRPRPGERTSGLRTGFARSDAKRTLALAAAKKCPSNGH
jgi:hypothetical protein